MLKPASDRHILAQHQQIMLALVKNAQWNVSSSFSAKFLLGKKVIEASEKNIKEGGAIQLNGKLIEDLHIREAKRILFIQNIVLNKQ